MSEHRFTSVIGEEYDLFAKHHIYPHHDELQQATVGKLKRLIPKIVKSPRILEIGYGTGITSSLILSQLTEAFLLGVDSEAHMTRLAECKLEKFDLSRYRLDTEDALSYLRRMPDSSVDGVVSVWVLHNMENNYRRQVLSEIYRVLKPNCPFVNADKVAEDDLAERARNFAWAIKQYDKFEQIGRSDLKAGWIKHCEEDEDPSRILIDSDYFDQLESIGFPQTCLLERWHMDALTYAIK